MDRPNELKKLRLMLGASTEEMGKACDCSAGHYRNIELGRRTIHEERLKKLATFAAKHEVLDFNAEAVRQWETYQP